jgi:hypothetical protein
MFVQKFKATKLIIPDLPDAYSPFLDEWTVGQFIQLHNL